MTELLLTPLRNSSIDNPEVGQEVVAAEAGVAVLIIIGEIINLTLLDPALINSSWHYTAPLPKLPCSASD